MNWDIKYIKLADYIAQWSKDTTHVGAVIVKNDSVISMGFNGLPCGCVDDERRYERPAKYEWMVHAEEAAILNAAKNGISLKGSTIYINWFPCARCAGMIVNSGISKLCCDKIPDYNDVRYGESFRIAKDKLVEGEVEIEYLCYDANR